MKKRKRPLAEPTRAMPGTAEKIKVMAWRQHNRFQIFHPDDAKMDEFRHARRPIALFGSNGKCIGGGVGGIFGWEQVEDGPEQRELGRNEDWWGQERMNPWDS